LAAPFPLLDRANGAPSDTDFANARLAAIGVIDCA
jgi:hypothetical protein